MHASKYKLWNYDEICCISVLDNNIMEITHYYI